GRDDHPARVDVAATDGSDHTIERLFGPGLASPGWRPAPGSSEEAAAGHGLDVEGLVDVRLGQQPALEDDLADRPVLTHRRLDHVGDDLVAEVRVERGADGR